jgi:hypothetical protein
MYLKQDVSETEFFLCHQVEPTYVGPKETKCLYLSLLSRFQRKTMADSRKSYRLLCNISYLRFKFEFFHVALCSDVLGTHATLIFHE